MTDALLTLHVLGALSWWWGLTIAHRHPHTSGFFRIQSLRGLLAIYVAVPLLFGLMLFWVGPYMHHRARKREAR